MRGAKESAARAAKVAVERGADEEADKPCAMPSIVLMRTLADTLVWLWA